MGEIKIFLDIHRNRLEIMRSLVARKTIAKVTEKGTYEIILANWLEKHFHAIFKIKV
jgi:hypothetical protein